MSAEQIAPTFLEMTHKGIAVVERLVQSPIKTVLAATASSHPKRKSIAVRENHRSWMLNSLPGAQSRLTAKSSITLDHSTVPGDPRGLGTKTYQDLTPPTIGIPASNHLTSAADALRGLRAPLRKHLLLLGSAALPVAKKSALAGPTVLLDNFYGALPPIDLCRI